MFTLFAGLDSEAVLEKSAPSQQEPAAKYYCATPEGAAKAFVVAKQP